MRDGSGSSLLSTCGNPAKTARREPVGAERHRPPHAARQRQRRRGLRLEPVARISEEQLVAAVARQRDGHRPSGDLRHEIRRDRGRVRERLVEHVREPIHDVEHLPLVTRLLVVVGAQVARDGRGVVRFVELGIVEPDQ